MRIRRQTFGRTLALLLALAALLLFANCGDPEPAPQPTAVSAAAQPTIAPAPPQSTAVPATPQPAPAPTSPPPASLPVVAAFEVSAEAGAAVLHVHEGALPAGVSPTDIRVEPVPATTLADDVAEESLLAAFNLEPSGLQFDEPVTLEIGLPYDGLRLPNVWIMTDEGAETVRNAEIIFSPAEGKMTILAEIEHFSSVIVDDLELFELTFDDPPEQYVRVEFDVTGTVSVNAGWSAYGSSPKQTSEGSNGSTDVSWSEWTYRVELPYQLEGEFSGIGVLSPEVIPDSPASTAVDSFTYETDGTFECTAAGATNFVEYSISIAYTQRKSSRKVTRYYGGLYRRDDEFYEPQASWSDSYEDLQRTATVRSEVFECVAVLPTPSLPTPITSEESPTEPDNVTSEESTTEPTPTPTPPPAEPGAGPVESVGDGGEAVEMVQVNVIVFGGQHYPAEQFHIARPDRCGADHIHANSDKVFSLEGGSTIDPDPDKCGFGEASAVEEVVIEVPLSDWEDYDQRRTAEDFPEG